MSPEQFAYWLQGFVELNNGVQPTAAQWNSVVAHLKTVFHKVTPPVQITPGIPSPLDQARKDWEVKNWPEIKPPQVIC